jgi:hypothetical protein
VGRELPHVLSTPIHPQDSKYSQDSHRATSSNVLNAAIGFLAFATLLIGAKLYSDHRVAERARASEQPQRMTTVAPTAPKTASPSQNRGPSQNPGGNGNGNGNDFECCGNEFEILNVVEMEIEIGEMETNDELKNKTNI